MPAQAWKQWFAVPFTAALLSVLFIGAGPAIARASAPALTQESARKHLSLSPEGKILSSAEAEQKLRGLPDPEAVESLHLSVDRITPALASRIAALPSLWSLHLRYGELAPEAVSHFGAMRSVGVWHLEGPATDELVEAIFALPRTAQATVDVSQLTQRGHEAMGRCERLKLGGLSLLGTIEGESLFAALGKSPHITGLSLGECTLDAEATRGLAKLKRLQALQFARGCQIEGDLFGSIEQLSELRIFRLQEINGPLADNQIESLSKLTKLEVLDLPKATLAQAHFDSLAKLERLQELNFTGKAPEAAIERFLKARSGECKLRQYDPDKEPWTGTQYRIAGGELKSIDLPEVISVLTSR